MISNLVLIARLGFAAALLFTLANAVMPPAHTMQILPWDKAQHFVAFYVLTGLAAAAFPRTKLAVIGVSLSALGASIELVQALPIVARDCDFWDWVADSIAILAALAPMILVWWRREAGRGQKNIDT